MNLKESEIQALIVSALRFKGYLVYMNYQNVTLGSFRKGEMLQNVHAMHASLKKTGWTKGIPDLTVIGKESNGNHIRLYIECKSPQGTVSEDQKHMIKILTVLGEEVRVVRSLEQIEDLLEKDLMNIECLLSDFRLQEEEDKKKYAAEKLLEKEQKKIQKKEAQKLERLKKKELKQLEKSKI